MLISASALSSRISLAVVAFIAFLAGYYIGRPSWDVSSLAPHQAIAPRVLARIHPSKAAATEKVPHILHYIFGLSSDFGGKPFGFVQYLAISSAIQTLSPDTVIYFHHIYEPTGWYWDQVKPRLTLVKTRDVKEVFGRPVTHFAHKADVIRLEVLRDQGGIYLDLDVLVLKPFDGFFREDFVMGVEAGWEPGTIEGLCNAVMISRPYAPFVTRWIEQYRTYDDVAWNAHSVALPLRLSERYPQDITVMDKYTFFYPLYFERHFESVHGDGKAVPRHDFSQQFAYHMWETLAYEKYLKDLDPIKVYERDTAFTRLARRWISKDAVESFRKQKI